MAVKVYAFVNDTSFFNKAGDGTYDQIDQGACCASQKVVNMFAEPATIADPRSSRLKTNQLYVVSSDVEAPASKLKADNTYFNGKMSLSYDKKQYTDNTIAALNDSVRMQAVFSFIELLGNYQRVVPNDQRESVDWKNIAGGYELNTTTGTYVWKGLALAEDIAKANCEDPLHPEVDCIRIDPDQTHETTESYVKDIQNVYYKFNDGTEFSTNMIARKEMVILFNGRYEKTPNAYEDLPIEMHVFWGREACIKNYALTYITNVIFPCIPENLYHLLEIYGSVGDFLNRSSKDRSQYFNSIISSGDQTGVYTFATDYYAYPDVDPTNRFEVGFGVVYKGAVPSLTDVRQKILDAIHHTDTEHHSDEEWKKKLPGLFSEMRFFLIPIYDGVYKDADTKEHRRGIVQLSRINTIVSTVLPSAEYLKYKDHFSIIAPIWQKIDDRACPKYQLIAVAHPMNSEGGNEDLASVYPDFIGVNWGDPETDKQSDATKDFNQGFDNAFSKAINNQEGGRITEDEGKNVWVTFNVSTTQFFVLTKGSWEEDFPA